MYLNEKYKTLFAKYGITTPLRIAHFMAQIQHESNFKAIGENLSYSKDGLLRTFGKYFTENIEAEPQKAHANQYARQPMMIANRVYANRMGNGNEQSGEGWKYRGRGFIQVTGKSNYIELSRKTGIDFVNNPDLLLTEANALISALWFWNSRNLNALSDKDDVRGITQSINGGNNGLAERISFLNQWKEKLRIN
jgi:putative chitinase